MENLHHLHVLEKPVLMSRKQAHNLFVSEVTTNVEKLPEQQVTDLVEKVPNTGRKAGHRKRWDLKREERGQNTKECSENKEMRRRQRSDADESSLHQQGCEGSPVGMRGSPS